MYQRYLPLCPKVLLSNWIRPKVLCCKEKLNLFIRAREIRQVLRSQSLTIRPTRFEFDSKFLCLICCVHQSRFVGNGSPSQCFMSHFRFDIYSPKIDFTQNNSYSMIPRIFLCLYLCTLVKKTSIFKVISYKSFIANKRLKWARLSLSTQNEMPRPYQLKKLRYSNSHSEK